jgi:O-antigen ligase
MAVGLIGLTAGVVAAVAGPAAGLLIILTMLAALVSAFMPGLVFAAYLLIPFYKGALQPYSPVDLTVLLALVNVLQIIPVFLNRRERHVSRAGMTLWVLLALLVLAGITYAPDQDLALQKAALWWALVFLPMIPAALRVGSEERYVRQFVWAFFGMGALVVVSGIATLSTTRRLVLFGENTIEVGRAALLAPLTGIVFVLQHRSPLLRGATVVLIPAALVVALASGSRGPLLVLVLLGVLGTIRSLWRPRGVNWRFAGAAAGLAVASMVVVSVAAPELPGQSIARFGSFGDFLQSGLSGGPSSSTTDLSSSIRVNLFGYAVSLFEEQPVLGVGTGGFEPLSRRYLDPINAEPYPHNALLQFAAEFGLVGIATFVSLVLLAVTRRLPLGPSMRAVRILYLFFFLNSMVSLDIYTDRTTWGLLLLLLLIDVPPVAVERAGNGAVGGA